MVKEVKEKVLILSKSRGCRARKERGQTGDTEEGKPTKQTQVSKVLAAAEQEGERERERQRERETERERNRKREGS